MNTDKFDNEEKIRVEKLFSTKHKKGFNSKTEFSEWYLATLKEQKYCCYYCETSIFEIQKLIEAGKLKKRKIGYGYRGPVLEIDKKINENGYIRENCVLSCYYCNNDKSYTLNSEDYKTYFGENRKRFFEKLSK